jgi:hypothetical protein
MKGFGNLMDIAQAKELQKLEAAQREQQKLYAMNEKRSVELKYGHCEKTNAFKDPIRKEIEDLWVNLGNRLNESLDTVNGIKQETIVKVWDLSKMELDSIVNASKAHKNQVEVYQAKIMNCANVSQADPIYAQLEFYHQQEMGKLKATANSFIQKCVSKANELMLPGQVEQLQLNNPVMNPSANDDLLQKIQELQEKLAQKDSIINSLSQGMQMAQGAIVQAQQIIQEKDIKIADQKVTIDDQKITIDDLREHKIILKEKVDEQKIKIDTLTDTNLEQVEKIHKVSDKYLDLKTHFVDLVTLHQEADPDYVPVVDLAGLNLDQ